MVQSPSGNHVPVMSIFFFFKNFIYLPHTYALRDALYFSFMVNAYLNSIGVS